MKRIPLFCVLLLTGCAEPYFGGGHWQSVGQIFSLDAVKRITPAITAGDSVDTYGQSAYDLGPEARLLLRYENFSRHTSYVDVDLDPTKNKRVWVHLAAEKEATVARAHVQVCPLVTSWMMLATWRYFHPFGGGKWRLDGGDYETAACQSAVPLAAIPDPADKPEVLKFDMTTWFIDYSRGRGVNYGWVVLSDVPVRIVGEVSPSLSPRILFDKYLGH